MECGAQPQLPRKNGQHDGVEVHVIVAIEMGGIASVESAEAVQLLVDTRSNGSEETGVEEQAIGSSQLPEARGDAALGVAHMHGDRGAVERLGEVEVQACGERKLTRAVRGALRVRHVNHRRGARYTARNEARGDLLGRVAARTPIVCVHDQQAVHGPRVYGQRAGSLVNLAGVIDAL